MASHARSWGTAATITDPAHVDTARRMREDYGRPATPTGGDLLRDLADYDTAFGVDLPTPAGLGDTDGEVA